MARKFSQRHYIAVADVLVESLRQARREDYADELEPSASGAAEGVHIVHEAFVAVFTRDSAKFDEQKFDRYISKQLTGR